MPLHNWIDEQGWDSVYSVWLVYLLEHIQERLPIGYKAFLGGVPCLTLDVGRGKPNINVCQWGTRTGLVIETATSGTSVLEPDLETSVSLRLEPQRGIYVDFRGQLVAVLELVSPCNKDRSEAKATYTNRYLGYLQLGVHLLLVDVLSRPKGFSFSDAVTSRLGMELSPLEPPFAVTFRVGEIVPLADDKGTLVGLWRRGFKPGQTLPTLPLPLNVHQAVMIDLEETYQRAAKRVYLD